MEVVRAAVGLGVDQVLAELDFLEIVDRRGDLYSGPTLRRAVHRWQQFHFDLGGCSFVKLSCQICPHWSPQV